VDQRLRVRLHTTTLHHTRGGVPAGVRHDTSVGRGNKRVSGNV
jgi:hypothetical protein